MYNAADAPDPQHRVKVDNLEAYLAFEYDLDCKRSLSDDVYLAEETGLEFEPGILTDATLDAIYDLHMRGTGLHTLASILVDLASADLDPGWDFGIDGPQ